MATTPRRSPFALLAYDRAGNLHGGRLIGVAVGGMVLLALGTFAALLAAGVGNANVLGMWVLAGFVAVKIPMLTLLWWLLVRHSDPSGAGGWTRTETAEILEYIETQARDAVGRPDAAERLAYFSAEAWNVTDRASDDDKAAAAATAVRVQGMAEDARALRSGRRPPEG